MTINSINFHPTPSSQALQTTNKNSQNTNPQTQAEFVQNYKNNDQAYNPLDYGFRKVDLNDYAEFTELDTTKTLQNVYKLFSQLMSKFEDKESYTKEELLQNFPFAFEFDKKTLEITKTYTFDELNQMSLKQRNKANIYISFANPWQNAQSAEKYKLEKNEDIFSYYGMDIGSKLYTQEDGSISKMGVFHAFATRISQFVSEGQTSIRAKLLGLDRSLSEESVNDLRQFLEQNKLGNGEIFIWVNSSDERAYQKLLNSNLSIDEFKEKYLEFKSYVEAKQAKWLNENSIQNNDNSQSDEANKKTFTPIQAESKNETYKAIDTNELLKKLLEESFDEKDFLEMIFGIKDKNLNLKSLDLNSSEFLNSNDLVSMLSKINLNTFHTLNKSLDVKV
ncbi:hypothetical protein CQA38_06765 [Campylobacter sp. MIT 12-5580]|uniref:Cj0814 family flagellar-dependent secreted protein n=1 Tax=Campylobacter sp. MIT 12-5580 TaxID=2040651 RepID=UPI0010F44F3C|nr:hypothetical protein [Campylobacter sp. MIT 12-5580]TKX28836.1 hypothetical protein CQA38_06765 [Campylobacter sp. MIT 12-5580]